MKESELLAHIYARSADLGPDVTVGPGDDAAVVTLGTQTLLLTVDQLIEGRHYLAGTPLDRIAHKAVARSLSDIAAMGGAARFSLVTAALAPDFQNADRLFELMQSVAASHGATLVGGDIAVTPGPTVFTVTVVGEPHPRRGPVLRAGAEPGDHVHLTGPIGGSLGSGHHLTFTPRLAEAAALCESLGPRLHAMIDLSDGLGRDAARVALASGVRLEFDARLLPLTPGLTDPAAACADGEDYELLFTAPDLHVPGAHRIGRVLPGSGTVLRTISGAEIDLAHLGWDHAS